MPEALVLDNVTIDHVGRRGTQRIVTELSLRIGAGEALALVGESGCGKSTVALAAMRYLPRGMRLTAGRILVDGRDLATASEAELTALRGNRVAMVYQDPMSSLNPVMTIGRQLAEVPLLHGERDAAAARARAIDMLREVRLPDAEAMMERYPHQLSGGQQQRVVIAMALMARPALLIMDEPTTGLDVTIEAAILELVRDLRAKLGAAILFISHNLGTVARVCERMAVLYAGRIVETGGTRDVFARPAHPYTRGLLAALPRLRQDGPRTRLQPIEGTLAAGDRARPGCAFAPRCGFAVERLCATGAIPLAPIGGDSDHAARCTRLGEIDALAPAPTLAGASPPADAPVLLAVRGLTKRYELGARTVRALTDVDLELRRGSTLAIVGESGCGKSTLARVLSGLVAASGGEARLAEIDIAQLTVDARPVELRRRVQMVFQNPDSTLNPSHSIGYALLRPLMKLRGLSRRAAQAEIGGLLETVRLSPDIAARKPHELSGGQRQRVAIARALAGAPDLVIADEPVSALDVSVQAAILNLLEDLRTRAAISLALISHDLALVRHMADWVAVMYLGRVVEYGPVAQVFAPPFHPYTSALLAVAPSPDPDQGPPGTILEGAMPSASEEITGCVFASRCPQRMDGLCERVAPPVRRFGSHVIACHLDPQASG
jgi:peptide/nickel transport system ATP-binding protein